jgi:hypothetical protein
MVFLVIEVDLIGIKVNYLLSVMAVRLILFS